MRKIFIILFAAFAFCNVSAQNKSQTENVFVITLDGLRWQELFTGADSALVLDKQYVKDPLGLKSQFWADSPEERRKILMPFFWSTIASKGQLYGNRFYDNKVNCSNHMWFSYPGYNEILCGYADDQRIKSNNKIANPNTTVLEFLNRQSAFKGKVAAFGSWDVFPFIINEERSNIPVNAGFEVSTDKNLTEKEKFLNQLQGEIPSPWPGVRLDAFTHHYAMEYLKKNKPRVVYISYGETDDFAHEGKYDAYLKSAYQTDQFIKSLWEWTQSQAGYKDKTTFIITTDHGRGTRPVDHWRSHGTEIPGSDQIWIAVIGPDTEPAGEMKTPAQYFQNQVAGTAAALLNVKYTAEKTTGEAIRPVLKRMQ